MKSTFYAWLAAVLWLVFIFLAVINPGGWAVMLIKALLWAAFACVWLSGAACVAALLSGGVRRQAVIASLAGRVFGVSSPYGRWLIRLLVIIFLVSTGSLISLVIYLITMVIAQVLKSVFNDPVLTCCA
ncbi:DNZ54_00345 family protein [Pantoea coffeiphila]|uniref:Uncharacterized protein n=1 Tax=Pantoea coffeiphila TaxID=1465635 RepID=A0A2S9IBZ3_9GAMM|nr:DNZ54_00345 family protein [Pantoea coffeiphila]PRD15319.1 hypothetical protein CQW29_12770 [Pantoea coffeiphila]